MKAAALNYVDTIQKHTKAHVGIFVGVYTRAAHGAYTRRPTAAETGNQVLAVALNEPSKSSP